MTGIPLIIAFFIMIVVMIVAISKFKIHPFLSIMGVSLILALLALPLAKVPGTIGAGFSGTFSSLGIVIILGAMIGFFLEKTGAALTMADWVIRRVGDKHPELAILLMGWIVSIPVFCDSGYVILNPIRKAIVKKTGVSAVAMAVALSAGLYTSHVFIPPTPGPIAAAQSLGLESHMLMVILVGFLVSIPSLAAGYFYARIREGSFDLYYGETRLTPDFDLRPLLTQGGSLNFGGYHDPDMESTLAAARKSGDRSALCKQFAEQMPFIPIAFEREQVIIRKNLINGFSPVPYSVFFGQENWTRVYAAESGSDAQTDEAAQ